MSNNTGRCKLSAESPPAGLRSSRRNSTCNESAGPLTIVTESKEICDESHGKRSGYACAGGEFVASGDAGARSVSADRLDQLSEGGARADIFRRAGRSFCGSCSSVCNTEPYRALNMRALAWRSWMQSRDQFVLNGSAQSLNHHACDLRYVAGSERQDGVAFAGRGRQRAWLLPRTRRHIQPRRDRSRRPTPSRSLLRWALRWPRRYPAPGLSPPHRRLSQTPPTSRACACSGAAER